MRRYLVLSVLGACLLVFVPGTTAFAGNSTYYVGKNSQGQKFLFSVDQTAGGPRFDPFFTNMTAHCPVTGTVIGISFSFEGFRIPIKNGKFSLRLNDLTDLFTWNGTITSKKATGTESFDLAAFDRQKGLQDCTTGSLRWTATGLAPASAKAAPRASYRVNITKAADGSVHFSLTH